jgi:hypothetical protein
MIPIVRISLPTFRLGVMGATAAALVPVDRAAGAVGIFGIACVMVPDTLDRAGAGDWARRWAVYFLLLCRDLGDIWILLTIT